MSGDTTRTITVGKITVTIRELPARSLISCGPAVCDVGPSVGQRFFDELTRIREVLLAAHTVIVSREWHDRPTTPDEMHLARMLVEMEINP